MSHRAVAIGASAGGVEALRDLFAHLPADLDAAVFVTLHVPPFADSALPEILSNAGPWPALHPHEGERILPKQVYIAPPDHHLIVRDGAVHLSRGPRENGHRPAVDALFRSVARGYGRGAIGIVLSGLLDDGTCGLDAIRMAGGIGIAQDPADAVFPEMPRSAIAAGVVDHVVATREAGPLLTTLPVPPADTPDSAGGKINQVPDEDDHGSTTTMEATDYTCPDCGGVLRKGIGLDSPLQFRCHVGHRWSSGSLRASKDERVEEALWIALRTLSEKQKLIRGIMRNSSAQAYPDSTNHYGRKLEDMEQQIRIVRTLLEEQGEERKRQKPGKEDPG